MKILFSIKALNNTQGGAERVLADITAGLAEKGHEISILSFDPPDGQSFYPLHAGIKRLCLGLGKTDCPATVGETLVRLLALRRAVKHEKPDMVVAFMHSMFVPMALALIGTGIPVIASEHIVPTHYKGRRFEFLLLLLSSLFVKKITVLSHSIKATYPRFLHHKLVPLANPVHTAQQQAHPAGRNNRNKTILNVGRLDPQKDQKTLIRAFSMLADRYPDWNVKIVGEGQLRSKLETLITACNLEDRITLPGKTPDISTAYCNAHIFALPSRYESFGLATAEAMSYGLPVVGFADCPGTNELVIDGQNGLLAQGTNRVTAFAEKLEDLMTAEDKRVDLGHKGIETVRQFSPGKIVDQWETLIRQCAQ